MYDEDLALNNLKWLISQCECRSLRFNRYSFLDWTLPLAPVVSGWKVQEELPAWTPAGANSVFFKLWVTSKAKRGKHVDYLDWFDLIYHFRGVFPFFELLWVHLFCFSFHVGECMLVLRWTRAQIKIYIFISSRLVSLIFGPICCCYIPENPTQPNPT